MQTFFSGSDVSVLDAIKGYVKEGIAIIELRKDNKGSNSGSFKVQRGSDAV